MKRLLQLFGNFLWEFWCLISIIGIWPRYIEPRLLKTTRLKIVKNNLPTVFCGIKILQFTDLHFSKKMSRRFLHKISKRIQQELPDAIVFTGDFICYSNLEDKKFLLNFLKSLQAPLGCYCIFGNHDYEQYITQTLEGAIDVIKKPPLFKALRRFFKRAKKNNEVTPIVDLVQHHQELIELLKETSFKLLENETHILAKHGSFSLKLTGLGDLWLNRCKPEKAFSIDASPHFTIALTHNPESLPLLKTSPVHLVLAGHTHGEQVCFPGFLRKISKKITGVTKLNYTRGLYQIDDKQLYVNRGVGCHKVFRWGSIPELLLITLHHG